MTKGNTPRQAQPASTAELVNGVWARDRLRDTGPVDLRQNSGPHHAVSTGPEGGVGQSSPRAPPARPLR